MKIPYDLPLLTVAVMKDDVKAVEMLLGQKKHLRTINEDYTEGRLYYPPLYYAGSVEVVEALLKAGAEVTYKMPGEDHEINLIYLSKNFWRSSYLDHNAEKFSSLVKLQDENPEFELFTLEDCRYIITEHLTDSDTGDINITSTRCLSVLVELKIDLLLATGYMVRSMYSGWYHNEDIEQELDFLLEHVGKKVLFSKIESFLKHSELDDHGYVPNVNSFTKFLRCCIERGMRFKLEIFELGQEVIEVLKPLFDLLAAYGLPISAGYLREAVRSNGWSEESDDERIPLLIEEFTFFISYGCSVLEKDEEGNNALSLATELDLPEEVMKVLIREANNEISKAGWLEKHKKKFSRALDEIKNNLDFGINTIMDFVEAYSEHPIDELKKDLIDREVHGPIAIKTTKMTIKPPSEALYMSLRRGVVNTL